jgi:hypothetical protein
MNGFGIDRMNLSDTRRGGQVCHHAREKGGARQSVATVARRPQRG